MWAAELDANGLVLRVIRGDANWASEVLGGNWRSVQKYDETEVYPSVGYGYDQFSPKKFALVAPAALEKTDNDQEALPPDSLWWQNGKIDTIENIAKNLGVLTAEEAQQNKPVREKGRP
jgi:hypothetical protein